MKFMEHLITCDHVSYSYHTLQGETPALSDIHFTIEEGEFLSIVGPSGCGKSTLLSLLCGLVTPESGSVLFRGKPVTKENSSHIGYMLQHDHLFEWRSVEKNVILGLEIQNKLNDASKKEAADMLKNYGLYSFAQAKPSQLSGGMRQRAALIRTLLLHPDLLLLDEPFSALDYQTRLNVSDDISTILRETKKTAVLVTHDLSEAVSFGDRIIVLSAHPGSIQTIVKTDFPPDVSPLNRRNLDRFKTYFNIIWKELNLNE